MQQGQGYTQDDFTQPAFCRACGTHVPKSFLASSGGLCAGCLRNLQQMQQPMSPTGQMYAQPYPRPRGSFFRSAGCMALLAGLASIGLLGYGAKRYLKLDTLSTGGHQVSGVGDQLSKSAGSLVDQPIESSDDSELRNLAAAEMANGFGDNVVSTWGMQTEAIRNKPNQETTYYVGGDFTCLVNNDRENVHWRISYVKDEQGKWRMTERRAWYDTDNGYAQFDFDVKKFIHLAH